MSDFDTFIDLVQSTQDRALLEDLLIGITTPKERAEIVQRLEIARRLLTGETQLRISKELGVGIATVTRGSKELAHGRFKVLRK